MTITLQRPPIAPASAGPLAQATLIAAALVPMLGGATIAPALPQIRAAFADTPNAAMLTAMILSIHALAIMILSPLAGWIGDRLGRQPILLVGLAGFAIAGTSGSWLPNLPAILAGRLVLGASIALLMTSVTGLVGDLFDEEGRRKLLSRQQAASSAGGLLFMLGAGALATLGWQEAFLMYLAGAVLFLPALIFLPRIRPAQTSTSADPAGTGRLGRWLIAPVTAMFMTQLLFYVIPTQIPGLLATDFGASPLQTSMILALMMLTMLPISLLYQRFSKNVAPSALIAVAFAAPTAGFAILSLAESLWSIVAGLMITAAGLAIAGPTLSTWIIALAGDTVRGRAIGILTTGLFAGQFLSPVLTQPIINTLGLRPTFHGLAAAAALTMVGYATVARHTTRP